MDMSTQEVRKRALAFKKGMMNHMQGNFSKISFMESDTLITQISHTWTGIEDNTRMERNMASVFISPEG
jgi:hypothetical protein